MLAFNTITATITAMLALAGTTLAAPTPSADNPVQSCHCSDRGNSIGAYGVYIGVTYAGGSGCDNVYNALENSGCLLSSWQCVEAGDGNTQLYFNAALGNGGRINSALESMYPTVQGGFNCPDY